MKKLTLALLVSTLAATGAVHAQMGRSMGPHYNSAMAKLFGDNPTFSADIEIQSTGSKQTMTMPGKMFVDTGKSRFEMNFSDARGGEMSPGMGEHMKAMGMDKTVAISRPDTKMTYTIFPGLSAYVETPQRDPDAAKPESALKMESTHAHARQTAPQAPRHASTPRVRLGRRS